MPQWIRVGLGGVVRHDGQAAVTEVSKPHISYYGKGDIAIGYPANKGVLKSILEA